MGHTDVPFPYGKGWPSLNCVATNPRAVGEPTQAIAAELRAQRGARRLKQEEVSAGTGIPVNTISKIERGQTAIDVEQIEKIATFYGMLPEDLWRLAREHAALRDKGSELGEVYRADGSINPDNTRGLTPSQEALAKLAARQKSSPDSST